MTTIVLPPPIQAFIDATNSGDTERFVATFTQDAHLEDWGRQFHGHTGIRDWNHTDNIGKQAHFELVAISPGQTDQSYVVTVTVTGNGYNGTSPLNFILRDGQIADLRISG